MSTVHRRETGFTGRVAAVMAALAPGEVLSYGEVAAAAGSPGAARAVGRILRDLDGVPWWRVVRGDGRLAAPDTTEQARLLAAEGVDVRAGRAVPPGPAGSGARQARCHTSTCTCGCAPA